MHYIVVHIRILNQGLLLCVLVRPQACCGSHTGSPRSHAKSHRISHSTHGPTLASSSSAVPRREYGKDRNQSHSGEWKSEFQTNRGRRLAEYLSSGYLRGNGNDRRTAFGNQLFQEVRQAGSENQRALDHGNELWAEHGGRSNSG